MEKNKENVKKSVITETKIPLPLDPLPQVPGYLLTSKRLINDRNGLYETQRQPLKTINSASQARSGKHTNVDKGKERKLEICMKHVTVRKRRESPSEWKLKVFKDEIYNNDNVYNEAHCKEIVKNKEIPIKEKKTCECKKDAIGVAECIILSFDTRDAATSTPSVCKSKLEPARIKNIKRSLKRPHSRELQGLSPTKNLIKRKSDLQSKFNFGDRIKDRLQCPDNMTKEYMKSFCRNYTRDLYCYFLKFESRPLGIPRISSITRACIVNWIMKVNGEDGDPGVVQTACWYLDSLSAKTDIELEKLQVTAAACYWIAQKLNGPSILASRLVKNGGNAYTVHDLRLAEKGVLKALKFPKQPVIAYDYVTYLSWWCDSENPGIIEVASSFLCLCGLLVDKSLACEYPSVLAAAAVHNSIQLLNKMKLMPRLLSNPVFCASRKKATNFCTVSKSLIRSVRAVGFPQCEYRAPYDHYSRPPHMVAKKILEAISKYK